MFSSSPSSITAAMRPGMIAGYYPEREDVQDGWIEHAFSTLQQLLTPLKCDHHGIVTTINQQDKRLAELTTTQLNELLIELRREFRSQGLTQPLCLRSFALVRETAARTIGQRHYDVQLMAGWTMLHGQLAEMETGEGKTLAATLAAATAALAGIPVHVITVNDYLVQRDAETMAPLYRALGLSIGYVSEQMTAEQRQANYACDITYCSNKQVAFDYLRDRLHLGNERNQLRLQLETAGHHVDHGSSRSNQLLLRGLCFAIVDEADSVLIDEARTPLILTRTIDCTTEQHAYLKALKLAKQLQRGDDFSLSSTDNSIELSLSGQQKIAIFESCQSSLWRTARHREELVRQALHALHLLHLGRDYLVIDDKIVIVDTNTGRKMADRSWQRGLHQLVEAKENCPLTAHRQQLGRLTYQRFFRRYLRLAGMTGTAQEVRSELHTVYGLQVRRIPLHRPSQRKKLASEVYPHQNEKWAAVITSTRQMIQQGRPVLIGTGSVSDSELLSQKLSAAGLRHRVLNARQDKEEAQIVASAGQQGQVTVATNMAGRGTDIPLTDDVIARGGLHVIRTCSNDAQRIDRQLTGRSARQGDPGSHQVILSLEDAGFKPNAPSKLGHLFMQRTTGKGLLQQHLNLYLIRTVQRRIEHRQREARRTLLQHDHQIAQRLAFSGYLE